ncbi:DNA-binding transcriptional LysR family regulator [Pseudomonas duriflava]|uniref:DNA-binding transcriptional LysR family regulator n=1 Tax=Pseudomonas duriflava TaxID=459528 RepID=A0A562PTP2_9PSED|nr:LysR family transcriptional regulator [Pseudomonas duriflava]TWI47801.1 DNA-binding transcriptional LysR family regulator [Pseudomonas duriflava]
MRKPLLRMTLRQLQVFEAVCETRSYSRAADVMALTQPAVSLQIRQLEELVGQPLFEYSGRKLYLTEAAEALQRAGQDIFGRLNSLDMQLSNLLGALHGQLRLGVETSAQYLAPHLFAIFKRQHPEVNVHLCVGNHAQMLKRLSENRDEIVLMSLVPPDRDLEFLPFLNNAIVAVAPPEHPLCQSKNLLLKDLESYPLLIRESGSSTRQACDDYFKQKRTHFTHVQEMTSLEALREGVIAGLGLALLPRLSIQRELGAGLLHELPVHELPLYRSWCAVHLRGRHLSPVAQAFFTFIREERALISALAERLSGQQSVQQA